MGGGGRQEEISRPPQNKKDGRSSIDALTVPVGVGIKSLGGAVDALLADEHSTLQDTSVEVGGGAALLVPPLPDFLLVRLDRPSARAVVDSGVDPDVDGVCIDECALHDEAMAHARVQVPPALTVPARYIKGADGTSGPDVHYKLLAVGTHSDHGNGGRAMSYVPAPDNALWWECGDVRVERDRMTAGDVVATVAGGGYPDQCKAAIVLYKQVDERPQDAAVVAADPLDASPCWNCGAGEGVADDATAASDSGAWVRCIRRRCRRRYHRTCAVAPGATGNADFANWVCPPCAMRQGGGGRGGGGG